MSNKVYDILKFIAQIALPALATFYLAIAAIWGLPYGEQIAGTIMAIDTLLGTILGVSTKKYNARKFLEDKLDEDIPEELLEEVEDADI